MQYELEYVRMLMMEKITGTLEEREEMVLQELIRDHREIATMWEELQGRMSSPETAGIMSGLSERQEKVWEQVVSAQSCAVELESGATAKQVAVRESIAIEEPLKGNGRIFRFRTIAAAACFLIISVGGIFYFRANHRPATAAAVVIPTGGWPEKSIQLQLAGGRLIDLSNAGHSIPLQEANLKNVDKTLSFEAGDRGAGLNTLTVPVGLDYKIVLADGTEVWMNSATVLQFPFTFSGNTREISLNGEAYLKVAANPAKPFIVHLPHTSVQVLGTSFNIDSYDSGTVRVSLVSGAVKLKSNDTNKELAIRPGMEGVWSSVNPSVKTDDFSQHTFDEKDVLSWMHGVHVFYNASIQEISTVLPRWYGIEVVLDNTYIARERFSGFIDRNKPIQDFLENLKTTNSAGYYFKEGTLHLK